MRTPRIHVPQPLACGDKVRLPRAASEHLARVLRLGAGDPLVLFDGDGNEYKGELVDAARAGIGVRVGEPLAHRPVESPLHLTLAQSIARGEKMDWIVQKATELGVTAIVPIVTERTEVRFDARRAERRLAHWQAVIVAACEQSGRVRVPSVAPPQGLADWIAGLGVTTGLRLVLDPEGELSTRKVERFQRLSLVVGPEGGLSETDLTALRNAGFCGLRLGPRILRAETAGVSALAALQALHGDF
ncbi:MAG: 16S rRNA (uracil(1498)-N(3))-methyltransferase [Rhodanobacteraceae bacterium]